MKEKCLNLIKKCDYFGVTFNFHYKSKEKFRSVTGGIVFLLFLAIAMTYVIINLKSLLKREHMQIISYKTITPSTDKINFKNYSLTQAFGISCSDIYKNQEMEYFKIDANHVILTKNNGIINKEKTKLNFSYCKNENFYNLFNNSFEKHGLNKIFCFTDNNITVSGLFTDDIYQYVELTVSSTKTEESDFDLYYHILTADDCTFQLYHIDYGIDVNKQKNPVSPYIRQEFLKLSPIDFNKMEIYYFTQNFKSYENYLFNNHHNKYYAGFSYFSYYNLFKGRDRFEKKPDDYNKFAKYFLRSDNGRYTVVRKYMKFTEFLAGVSSITSQSLLFLYVFMTRINKFYAMEKIMMRVYHFIESNSGKNLLIKKLKLNFPHDDIRQIAKKYTDNLSGTIAKVKKEKFQISLYDFKNKKKKIKNLSFKRSSNDNITKDAITTDNFVLKEKKSFYNKILDLDVLSQNPISRYHLCCESVIYLFCPCFACKRLKIKNQIFKRGEKKLFLNTDFLSYIKNMQMLEILTDLMLEINQIKMIKFLSKPIISLGVHNNLRNKITWNAEEDEEITEKEIEDFCKEYKKLYCNKNKSKVENKLFHIVNLEIDNLIG
jgi:hypothetical protein